jgi:hypothetical protein
MYADRLVSLGKQAQVSRAAFERMLLEGDDVQVRDLLLPWHGIGEKVLTTFFALRRRWRHSAGDVVSSS